MSARPLQPAPKFLPSALRIMDLSIGEMLWSRRTVFMMLLVSTPVVMALFIRLLVGLGVPIFNHTTMNGAGIFGILIWLFYLRLIVPILGVFYGTSLIADEVEDKTITYLFTRPIPKGAVLVGKYLAYLVCTIFVVLPSVMLVYLLIAPMGTSSLGGSFIDLVKDLVLLAIGLVVYGAVFAFVGAQFKRPLLIGLVFIFGWEQIALTFPGYLRYYTVIYYVQALVPHAMPNDGMLSWIQWLFRTTPGLTTCLVSLTAIWGAFLWLASRVVDRKEYVLEQ